MLQLLNHSGFNGTTHAAPLPIHQIEVTARLPAGTVDHVACQAYSLRVPNNVHITSQGSLADGTTLLSLSIPVLNLYEGIRIQAKTTAPTEWRSPCCP